MDKNEWLHRLLRNYEGRLLRFAKRFVNDQHAREIVQETFLKIWREDEAALSGREAEWLFCVARNMALDLLKKEANVGRNSSIDPSDLASSTEPVDERMEREEKESAALRLIGELPKLQQEVMRLKFQEGFSYKEISSITGHSVSHVGVLIHEAMSRLRRELSPATANAAAQGGRK